MTKETLPWEDNDPHRWTCPVCWTGVGFMALMTGLMLWAVLHA